MVELIDKLLSVTGAIAPKSMLDSFDKTLAEADFDTSAKKYAGFMLWSALLIAVLVFFIAWNFISVEYSLAVSAFFFVLGIAMFYLIVSMIADSRAKKIDEVLPDAISMISANVRAGMTVENAVLVSARPEFGPLEEEIRLASAKTYGGMSMSQAFAEMGGRVRSNQLKRTVKMFIEGSKLGGQMAQLLNEIARDLRELSALRREIQNATLTYTIFILFSTVIASPVLFATSVYYAQVNEKVTSKIALSGELPTAGMGGFVPKYNKQNAISAEEFYSFAIATVLVTSFLSALVLALIRHGKATAGLKQAPMFAFAAVAVFLGTHYALTLFFKGFTGF
ncbi:type II secretion system F family protein [Candidatus Micrarchaeota archaeon]|nr:type II secretion system F family protein [Candidatus Micrarchaeota archaeon]